MLEKWGVKNIVDPRLEGDLDINSAWKAIEAAMACVSPIAHSWCGGHFTNINACGVWRAKTRIQVFRKELHTYVHLD